MGIICFIESGYEIKLLSVRNAIKSVMTIFGKGRNCVKLLMNSINKREGCMRVFRKVIHPNKTLLRNMSTQEGHLV